MFPVAALAMFSACALGADDEEGRRVTPNLPAVAVRETTLHIPTTLKAECAQLASLGAPPADLTVKQLFACLDDDSVTKLGAAYQKRVAKATVEAPANLSAFVTAYGDRKVTEVRLRDVLGRAPREGVEAGVEPPASRWASGSSGSWGLDPSTCTKSCLSRTLSVVNGTRRVGYSPAWTGAELSPTDGRRLLDEVNPGSFPDYHQADLSNQELVASGCGPTSAVNLLEWWNIPVYNGSTRLTTQDARTEYIAGRMDTLDGINFTDDEELIDFVTQYPKEQYVAGHIPGYPGWHYMIDDPSAWKVMMSYVARGYPVIVLYASGSTSMHWALITGYADGKLKIANAGDRTLADFYAQWHDWADLSWYADWATDLFVDPDTFVAYTGWGTTDGRPDPERFASRSLGSRPAGYSSGGYTYGFRYCVSAPDDIGFSSEMVDVPFWEAEPTSWMPGYCMYTARQTYLGSLSPSPLGAASSKAGTKLTVSVAASSALSSFIAANPGVRCEFYGQSSSGSWTKLVSRKCSDSGALSYGYTNNGQYTKLELHVHSADTARTTWTVTTY
jgi:peptidase C39-like protein